MVIGKVNCPTHDPRVLYYLPYFPITSLNSASLFHHLPRGGSGNGVENVPDLVSGDRYLVPWLEPSQDVSPSENRSRVLYRGEKSLGWKGRRDVGEGRSPEGSNGPGGINLCDTKRLE